MKILVLGSTGMLGSTVMQVLQRRYGKKQIFGTTRNFGKVECKEQYFVFDVLTNNFCSPSSFDYIINCIGVINKFVESVGAAQTIEVNSVFPHQLADYCEEQGSKLIHITTDCVFSGEGSMYTEEDTHDAIDLYGKSKSLGEPSNCMVLRTSIIGEEKYNKVSLIEWAKSMKGEHVQGYKNHFWNGMTTKTYGDVCCQIIDNDLYERGIFHIYSPEDVTKDKLLRLIDNKFDLNLEIESVEAKWRIDRTLRSVKELVNELFIPDINEQIWRM